MIRGGWQTVWSMFWAATGPSLACKNSCPAIASNTRGAEAVRNSMDLILVRCRKSNGCIRDSFSASAHRLSYRAIRHGLPGFSSKPRSCSHLGCISSPFLLAERDRRRATRSARGPRFDQPLLEPARNRGGPSVFSALGRSANSGQPPRCGLSVPRETWQLGLNAVTSLGRLCLARTARPNIVCLPPYLPRTIVPMIRLGALRAAGRQLLFRPMVSDCRKVTRTKSTGAHHISTTFSSLIAL